MRIVVECRSVPTQEPEQETDQVNVREGSNHESSIVLHRSLEGGRNRGLFVEPPREPLHLFDRAKLFGLVEATESEVPDAVVGRIRRHGAHRGAVDKDEGNAA